MAKRQEKLDFMEEHVNTMVEEMKKKNKLLQNLMLKQDSGALVSTDMDTDKVLTFFGLIINKIIVAHAHDIYFFESVIDCSCEEELTF